MRSLLLCGALLASAVVVAPGDAVHAGACYSDPVFERSWTGRINTGARVRDGACMEGTNTLTTLPVGTVVAIIAETDGWLKVKLPDGTKGWVGATLITVTNREGATNVKSEEKSYADKEAIKTETKKVEVKNVEEKPVADVDALTQRVKGYILLDVETNGEAWYVNPDEGKRYYMKDGKTAYEMMRMFGLGISSKDFAKLQAGDQNLKARLKGKIVLLVEQNGEAYYIHPGKGTLHYLKNGDEAYRVMRELSLGISRKDLKLVKMREFTDFVKEREKAKGKTDESKTSDTPAVSGSIVLSARVEDGIVYLDWKTESLDSRLGFKVAWSQDVNPEYPGDDAQYLSEAGTRAYKLKDLGDGVYYIRVCQYLGGSCGVYSNSVTANLSSTTAESGSTSDDATDDESSITVDLQALNDYWLSKMNALRAERGLRLLAVDERWMDTAMEWAAYMGSIDSATHNRPDGKSMHQWIDTKGLPFTARNSEGGWSSNYFTENIAWGYADGSMEELKQVLDDTLAFYLSEAGSNGPHYRTIYHPDWNSVGTGVYLRPNGNRYKVFVAFHYGSLVR